MPRTPENSPSQQSHNNDDEIDWFDEPQKPYPTEPERGADYNAWVEYALQIADFHNFKSREEYAHFLEAAKENPRLLKALKIAKKKSPERFLHALHGWWLGYRHRYSRGGTTNG